MDLNLNSKRCDLTHPTLVGVPVAFLDTTTMGPVQFLAQKNTTANLGFASGCLAQFMSFDMALVNTGNAMNLATGLFTAPVTGRYQFSFTAVSTYQSSQAILIVNNSTYVAAAYGVGVPSLSPSNNQYTMSLDAIVNLKAKDTVGIGLKSSNLDYKCLGGVFENSPVLHFTNFAGLLVDEDLSI